MSAFSYCGFLFFSNKISLWNASVQNRQEQHCLQFLWRDQRSASLKYTSQDTDFKLVLTNKKTKKEPLTLPYPALKNWSRKACVWEGISIFAWAFWVSPGRQKGAVMKPVLDPLMPSRPYCFWAAQQDSVGIACFPFGILDPCLPSPFSRTSMPLWALE